MSKRVLIVAAHPDDEVLGMGGTMARHHHEGDEVSVLFLGDGVSSRTTSDARAVKDRQDAAISACRQLGAEILGFEAFPDNSFDTIPLLEIAKAVERAKERVVPHLIYTHHGGDLNVDHRLACQATLTAFRPQPHETFQEIRCFETASATEWNTPSLGRPFVPDTFVEITGYMDQLVAALEAYHSEMRPSPHTRSIDARRIAAWHNGRKVGVEAAEAFATVRRVMRQ